MSQLFSAKAPQKDGICSQVWTQAKEYNEGMLENIWHFTVINKMIGTFES